MFCSMQTRFSAAEHPEHPLFCSFPFFCFPFPSRSHDIFTTFEGDNTVLLQQVASFLLKQYQKKFSGGPVIATFRYLSEVVSDALPVNPLTSHDAEPRHVREPAFLQRAMNHRVERLLHTAAARLREHAASKGQFEAWNQCLPHLLALATAHIEAVTLECSLRAVERCADPESKHALRLCTELFGEWSDGRCLRWMDGWMDEPVTFCFFCFHSMALSSLCIHT